MEKLQNKLQGYYTKEFKELRLLDELMLLDTDYGKYNDLINEKVEKLIEKITGNKLQFMIVLREISNMNSQYYNELEEYEKEVINSEIRDGLHGLIIESTESM